MEDALPKNFLKIKLNINQGQRPRSCYRLTLDKIFA